jgi:hypothetical protein
MLLSNRKAMNLGWYILLFTFALLIIKSEQQNFEQSSRTIHEPDLESLVKRVLTSNFTVDPTFIDFISHPSIYYTDFYGIYALKDFTSEKIIGDFIPNNADVIYQNNTIIELKFHSGWNAIFYPHSILVVKNASSPTDHVYLDGNNTQELIQHLTEFRDILKQNNLEATYLITNPYYDMEKQVDPAFHSDKPTVSITTDPTMTHFQSIPNAVMIYPDPVHGDLSWYMKFMESLNTAEIDWLGMEMLPSSMQIILDSFCTAPNDSAEYINARVNLTSYFLNAWTHYFHLNITSGEDSPYFKAVDMMRQKNGRVYGLDFDDINFFLFRYGESPFGAAVRSLNWANSVPINRRGIVFGGSAHFTSTKPINMQDVLVTRDASIKLFSIKSLSNSANFIFLFNSFIFYKACATLFVHSLIKYSY